MKTDIAVIGGGPAGTEAAVRLSKSGFSVTLIEKNELGGVCLNRGCIPTKTIKKSADIFNYIKDSNKYGLSVSEYSYNWENIISRVNRVVDIQKKGLQVQLKKVNVIHGEAALRDNNIIEVNDKKIEADKIIIATGSMPFVPDNYSDIYNTEGAFNPETIINIKKLPENIVVIGAGVSGCEWAQIFNSFGVNVYLIEIANSILPGFDKDITSILKRKMTKSGIKVFEQTSIDTIYKEENEFIIDIKGDIIKSSIVLFSTGRKRKQDYERNKDFILKNSGNIYVIGDAYRKNFSATRAIYEGYKTAETIAGSNAGDYIIPEGIYTNPEIGAFGMTEADCKEKNIDYEIEKKYFRSIPRSHCDEATDGLMKIIRSKDKVIGIHIAGYIASELIHIAVMRYTGKKIVPNHPSFSEIFGI